MKFRKHLSLLASAAVIAGVTPALTAQAQGVTCTLAAADCQLISDARANLSKETSFIPTFNFKLALTGPHTINVQASGTGAFALDTTAITNLQDRAALLKAVQMQLDVTGNATMGSLQLSGKSGLVIKDGVIYGLNPADNAWIGADLAQLMTMMQATGRTPTVRPNAMQGMMQQMMADPDVKAALMALPNIKGFITQQRLTNDADLEGQKMAQIQDTINPQVLFTSPDALPAFKALINASAKMSTSNGRMDMLQKMNDQELQGLLMMVGGVFGNTNVTITRWIGVDDKLFHALDVEVNLNIDSAMVGGPNSSGPINGTISFSVQLTKVGQPVTVTAPAGAKMIDPRLLRRGMGMGMMMPGFGMMGPFQMRPPALAPAAPTTQATAVVPAMTPTVMPMATMAATMAATAQ